MWWKALGVCVAAAAAGCASTAPDGDAGVLSLRGDADTAKVEMRWSGLDPYPAAERHCAKYGKTPRIRQEGTTRAIFDCV
jgi:hypothetical protein